MSVKQVEVVERSKRDCLPVSLLSWGSWIFVKEKRRWKKRSKMRFKLISGKCSLSIILETLGTLKVVSATFLLVSFVKRKHLWNKEKCFQLHFESSFRSWGNQILTFKIFKCHNVIKRLTIKHETHIIE